MNKYWPSTSTSTKSSKSSKSSSTKSSKSSKSKSKSTLSSNNNGRILYGNVIGAKDLQTLSANEAIDNNIIYLYAPQIDKLPTLMKNVEDFLNNDNESQFFSFRYVSDVNKADALVQAIDTNRFDKEVNKSDIPQKNKMLISLKCGSTLTEHTKNKHLRTVIEIKYNINYNIYNDKEDKYGRENCNSRSQILNMFATL